MSYHGQQDRQFLGILGHRVRRSNPPPQTLQEPILDVHNERQSIPQRTIQNRIAFMRHRCAAVIQNEEDVSDTEHLDTLCLIHVTWHSSAITYQVLTGVAYS